MHRDSRTESLVSTQQILNKNQHANTEGSLKECIQFIQKMFIKCPLCARYRKSKSLAETVSDFPGTSRIMFYQYAKKPSFHLCDIVF